MKEYLLFSSPEAEGISSADIKEYASALNKKGVCLHSLLIFKSNRLIAEGYERHYNKESENRMYSVSKTFTSAAIGCLIGEGKLALDDKVYKWFDDKYEGELHPYIREATIRDLLMMATPFDETTYRPEDKDWVKSFFTTEPSHRPGRVFNYDTSATLVLDAIIERITGLDFTDYLYDKVLRHIGFEKAPECVREPGGVQWGGSGILCTSRELATFALLFMNGGRDLKGNQLIPEAYVKEAIKAQICNLQSNDFAAFRGKGYGYQIWITENGFAFLGMGNQLAVCIPEKDFMLVCTADDQGNSSARGYIFDLLDSMILSKITPDVPRILIENAEPLCLDEYLEFPLPCNAGAVEPNVNINGKEFKILPNKNGFESISFSISDNEGEMKYIREGKEKILRFGINRYVDGIFPEIYSGMTINTPAKDGYKCTAAAVWTESDKLVLRCYLIDKYLGNFTANISFKGGSLDINFTKKAEWFLDEYTGYLSSAE